jgi:TolB-like protein
VRGRAQFFLGHFDQSKSDLLHALRLSPREPTIGVWHWYLGDAEFGLEDLDAAIDEYRKSIDTGYRTFGLYEGLAAAYAVQGKMEDARTALAEARRLADTLTVKWLITNYPNIPSLIEGVRKLGLPEECDPRSRRDFEGRPCATADTPGEPPHLSIVVLPFTNLSNDPNQDYFADGITENLTTDLSRIRNSFVIARNTAFTYKGKSIDAKAIGKELGVRYVLEGSVQRDQNRVRVNAQLIDAGSGAHLWADRFEEDVADLFKLQDEVVTRLADSLGFALAKVEAEKGRRSKNPDVIDLRMRGWSVLTSHFGQGPGTVKEARALFGRALQMDPDDADSLAGSAASYLAEYFLGSGEPGTDYETNVLGQADRAIALAPDNVEGYFQKADYLALTGRPSEALGVADAGLGVNPNYVPLYVPRIAAELSLGRFEQAKADAGLAVRLRPRDPLVGIFRVRLGGAELSRGHFDAAIDEFRNAIDFGDHEYYAYSGLAAAYAQAGKMDEAKVELAEARRLNPAITVKWMKEHTPNVPSVIDGLRKAGLPEE